MAEPGDGMVPPNAIDEEAAVLATLLLKSEELDCVSDLLRPEHFYSDAHRRIYQAVADLRDQGQPCDILTVRRWLSDRDLLKRVGGPSYLAKILEDVPVVANVKAYAAMVVNKWRLRQFISTAQELVASGYGSVEDIPEFLASAESQLLNVLGQSTDKSYVCIKDSLSQAFSELRRDMDARRDHRITVPTTGFRGLDPIIGGLFPGLYFIAARPSFGKTALMLNIALHAASAPCTPRTGVGIFSLETPHTNLSLRVVCAHSGFDGTKIRTRNIKTEEWSTLTWAMNEVSKFPILIDDRSGITMPQIHATVRRMRAELRKVIDGQVVQDLGLIGIDYLQLIEGIKVRGANREQEVAAIAKSLQRLAREENLPVICLSQLNRACESRQNKRPMLSDIRESGAVEQEADVVIALYRDEKYNPESVESRGITEAIVLKNRDGKTGTVELKFTPSCLRFEDRHGA